MKRLSLLSGVLGVAVAGAIATYPKPVHGDFDINGLNTQVQTHEQKLKQHDQELANHEVRITNTENKVVESPPVSAPQSIVDPAPALNSSNNSDTGGGAVTVVTSPSTPPTAQEMNTMLASLGSPGENRPAKVQGCKDLYASHNYSDTVPQYPGMHICSDQVLGQGQYTAY